MPAVEKRRIGRTSLEVTVLGLGCATLGGSRIDVSREMAEAIVRAACAAGISYIDAAPYYGFGQAERCVGDAMRSVPRDDWVLSTKVGRLLRPRLARAGVQLPHSWYRHPGCPLFAGMTNAVGYGPRESDGIGLAERPHPPVPPVLSGRDQAFTKFLIENL
jgi:hypothetical protein